jgi:two-component system chemotaxis sensor kinase CheA
MDKLRESLFHFFTSGKFKNSREAGQWDEIVRYIILNVTIVFGGAMLVLFGITVYYEGEVLRSILDFIMFGLAVAAFVLLRTRVPFIGPGILSVGPFTVFCALLVQNGGDQGFAGLWIYCFPMIAIFILGKFVGGALAMALLAATAVLTFVPGLVQEFNYPREIAFRLCGVYALVYVLTFVYEQIRLTKDAWVGHLTQALKTERDEIAVMKDNLHTGLFLMDRDLILQGQYSQALERVLAGKDLQGRNFIDLLSSSISAKEQETLRDYFIMVFDRAFDQKMLDEINPLGEFQYTSIETGAVKTLRGGFAPVDRGEGNVFILGTLEDVTAERELQLQLEAEEQRRQVEMRTLFEIIQVEPRVFSDFLEDTDYEFRRINDTLKDRRIPTQEALVEIYQSIHAVKSNAVILGLENFSGRLHELEGRLKKLRDMAEVDFEEMLHLTVALEKIMKETDRFRETIARIHSFKIGSVKKQDEYVLIESLSRASAKASADLDKKVRFVAEDIDTDAIENGPRRVIKEVLMQLVRNAVYHGIEAPAERVSLGKNEVGAIHLSIRKRDDQIHIVLRDDGKGLDFDRIRQKAEELHLMTAQEEADKNSLLRVIFSPGFSTAETEGIHAGRGIGLNLVRERIRDVRGTINLQTQPGKGTAFNIRIPLESQAS